MTSFEICKIAGAKPRAQLLPQVKRYAERGAMALAGVIALAGMFGLLVLVTALVESYRLRSIAKTGRPVRRISTAAPVVPVQSGAAVSSRTYTGPDRRVCQMIDQRAGELRRATDIPSGVGRRSPPPFSSFFRFPEVAAEPLKA